MKTLWRLFDGKKTIIGSAILALAYVYSRFAGIWEFDEMMTNKVVETLTLFGEVVAGGGLVHKLQKKNGAGA